MKILMDGLDWFLRLALGRGGPLYSNELGEIRFVLGRLLEGIRKRDMKQICMGIVAALVLSGAVWAAPEKGTKSQETKQTDTSEKTRVARTIPSRTEKQAAGVIAPKASPKKSAPARLKTAQKTSGASSSASAAAKVQRPTQTGERAVGPVAAFWFVLPEKR
jgi:hypothetical protein